MSIIILGRKARVLGKLDPGQFGPGARLSWAKLSWALNSWAPGQLAGTRTVGPLGPTVRGPNVYFLKADNWAPWSWSSIGLAGAGRPPTGLIHLGAHCTSAGIANPELSFIIIVIIHIFIVLAPWLVIMITMIEGKQEGFENHELGIQHNSFFYLIIFTARP